MTGTPNYGSSPVAQASGNPGAMAQASAAVREALHILSASVSKFPPGSKSQTKVASAIKMLAEAFPESESAQGVQKTEALGMAQQAQQQNPMSSLMRAMGGNAGMSGEQQQQGA
jgi:hypothetical protein